jgi:hypothetical protein
LYLSPHITKKKSNSQYLHGFFTDKTFFLSGRHLKSPEPTAIILLMIGYPVPTNCNMQVHIAVLTKRTPSEKREQVSLDNVHAPTTLIISFAHLCFFGGILHTFVMTIKPEERRRFLIRLHCLWLL